MHEVEGRIAVLDHPENLISALTVEGMWRVGICLMSTWDLSCGTLSNFPIAAHSSFTFSLISPKLSILVESRWFSLLASQINYFLTSKESSWGQILPSVKSCWHYSLQTFFNFVIWYAILCGFQYQFLKFHWSFWLKF